MHLQNDEESQSANNPTYQDINRGLHAVAAHLHRYTSELKSIDDTIDAIFQYHRKILNPEGLALGGAFQKIEDNLYHIASQLKAVKDFEEELEKKIQNSLALVKPPKQNDLKPSH